MTTLAALKASGHVQTVAEILDRDEEASSSARFVPPDAGETSPIPGVGSHSKESEMEQSAEINELAAALSKAQAAVKGAIKDSDNPAFKREGKPMRYADLESVKDACWEAAMANNLAILQLPGLTIDGVMHLTTMLTHSSGQWLRSTLSIPLAKVDAQGYGSAVTYARRYSLAALMGVTPEDDDGNAASNPSGADNSRRAMGNAGVTYTAIDARQCAELRRLLNEADTSEEAFCDQIQVGTLPELAARHFERAKGMLVNRIEAMKSLKAESIPY